MLSVKEYQKIIKPHLSDKRYHHSCEVAKAAKRLAKKYGADPDKAEIAGILHDILKDTPKDEQLKIMDRFGIILNDIEAVTPNLWHQISGAAYVKNELNIDDPDIVDPIRWHTSGKKDMTLMEKIVFVADFISDDRDYKGVDKMRTIAKESLDKAIIEGLSFTISELAENGKAIVSDTFDAYNDAVLSVMRGKYI